MSIYVGANSTALYTIGRYNNCYDRLSSSIKKLSSGLAVDSAADSPSDKAVGLGLTSQINALTQGSRNARIAQSTVEAADASISEINTNLQRMKELAEQASTGTYTDTQRIIINSEFQTVAREIDRIANDLEFNDIKLLNGSLSTGTESTWVNATRTDQTGGRITKDGCLKVHVGTSNSSAEDYYYIEFSNMTTNSLFSDYLDPNNPEADTAGEVVSIASQGQANRTLTMIDKALDYTTASQAHLGRVKNRLESTVGVYDTQAESLTATRSVILDVDVATEMANYAQTQVLAKSAVSMIAQANTLPSFALQLLQ